MIDDATYALWDSFPPPSSGAVVTLDAITEHIAALSLKPRPDRIVLSHESARALARVLLRWPAALRVAGRHRPPVVRRLVEWASAGMLLVEDTIRDVTRDLVRRNRRAWRGHRKARRGWA